MTSAIADGVRPWAPYEPNPPPLDTVAANRCVDSPPRGPWMIGYLIPRREEIRVLFQSGAEVLASGVIPILPSSMSGRDFLSTHVIQNLYRWCRRFDESVQVGRPNSVQPDVAYPGGRVLHFGHAELKYVERGTTDEQKTCQHRWISCSGELLLQHLSVGPVLVRCTGPTVRNLSFSRENARPASLFAIKEEMYLQLIPRYRRYHRLIVF
jgi:hypothetical protein